MRILIASESRFLQDSSGRIWTQGSENYRFWSAYREVFPEIAVLARLVRGADSGSPDRRADGEGVRFLPLDDYRGPWQYWLALRRLGRQARRAVTGCDALLLRAPGAVSYLVGREIQGRRVFGVEVLGDPWESLRPDPGTGPSCVLTAARRWSRRCLLRLCREAAATCYVTRSWLQRLYPPANGRTFYCSDVRIAGIAGEPQLAARLRRVHAALAGRQPWRLGFLGSLERLYKGPDLLIEAVALCRGRGFNVRLVLAGDGRRRGYLERLAARRNLTSSVEFCGALAPGSSVDRFLDSLDLFVLPSRTEGLPRALIEAMARGCPAIGSSAGGIPELLPPDALVKPGSAEDLAGRIADFLCNTALLEPMSRRNLEVAAQFREEVLRPVRQEFLCELRNLSM